jgi:predicted protein tyrosine phosphatase
MSWPTTRKHPRTLAEAWPREHAAAITCYRGTGRIRAWLLAIGIGVALAFCLAVFVTPGA